MLGPSCAAEGRAQGATREVARRQLTEEQCGDSPPQPPDRDGRERFTNSQPTTRLRPAFFARYRFSSATFTNAETGSRSVVVAIVASLPIVALFMAIGLLLFVFYRRPDLMGSAAPAYRVDDSREPLKELRRILNMDTANKLIAEANGILSKGKPAEALAPQLEGFGEVRVLDAEKLA